jgi:DNA-binding IclR family transcriptional regulator
VSAARDSGTGEDGKYYLQILGRAIAVLFAFTADRPEWTLDDLADHLALNKTSLLRILRTLEAEGFVVRRDAGYCLGSRVLDLSNAYLSTLSVHRVAQRHMARLAKACRQTLSLAVLDGFEVVYVGIEHAQREVGIQGEIGGRHPAHATALGKVLLADLSDDEVRQRMQGKTLERLTHRTIVDPDALLDHLQRVREQGYAVDDEERGIGIRCVAAPIRDHSGAAMAGLSLAGPIFHMTDDAVADYRAQVLEAVAAISHELGYRASAARPAAEPAGSAA